MDDDLARLRVAIDAIDDEILERLNRRAELVTQVGAIKRQKQQSFYVPARERQIVERLVAASKGKFPGEAIPAVFREIISACLRLEEPLKVAYFGPEATFTHMAAQRRFGLSALYVSAPTIGAVFAEVEKGQTDFGVVPVENSTEGGVSHTLDSFLASDLQICGEVVHEIAHCLLSHGDLGEIRKVYSHPQALAQCRMWLGAHLPGVVPIEVASTSQAARMAKDDPTAAAIASELAAQLNDVPIRARQIQDVAQNVTRFLVLCRPEHLPRVSAAAPGTRMRTSVLFTVRDQPGILYKVLQPFADRGVNLSKIESRPSRRRAWEYVFFLDVDGHTDDPRIVAAISDLRAASELVKVIGSYPCYDPEPPATERDKAEGSEAQKE